MTKIAIIKAKNTKEYLEGITINELQELCEFYNRFSDKSVSLENMEKLELKYLISLMKRVHSKSGGALRSKLDTWLWKYHAGVSVRLELSVPDFRILLEDGLRPVQFQHRPDLARLAEDIQLCWNSATNRDNP